MVKKMQTKLFEYIKIQKSCIHTSFLMKIVENCKSSEIDNNIFVFGIILKLQILNNIFTSKFTYQDNFEFEQSNLSIFIQSYHTPLLIVSKDPSLSFSTQKVYPR